MGGNLDAQIDEETLENELINTCKITDITKTTTEGESITLPWTVKKDGYVYTISTTGKVEEKVVAQATGLIIEPITLGVNETKTIENVTAEPENAEKIEITGYSSGDTSKATVNEKGEIKGIAEGTAAITVTAKGKLSGATITGTCEVTVTKQLITVTAEQIAANPKAYYGKKVENYKASADDTNTYRIFYVNTKPEGEFGDPQYTIYLKADDSSAKAINSKIYDLDNYASYDSANTKIRQMNPKWAVGKKSTTDTKTRGESEKDSEGNVIWNKNEQAAAYLCSPVNASNYNDENIKFEWKSYYKPNDNNVNYVIGGPSVEMYVESYNKVEAYKNATVDAAKKELGADYKTSPNTGYIYTIGGRKSTISNSETHTGSNSIDYSNTYNSMYCGKTDPTTGIASKKGKWYLASPSISSADTMCYCVR